MRFSFSRGVVLATVTLGLAMLAGPALGAGNPIDTTVPKSVVASYQPGGQAFEQTLLTMTEQLKGKTLSFTAPRRWVRADPARLGASKTWVAAPFSMDDIVTGDDFDQFMAAALADGEAFSVVTVLRNGDLTSISDLDVAGAQAVAKAQSSSYFVTADILGLFAVSAKQVATPVDSTSTSSLAAFRAASAGSASSLTLTELRTAVHEHQVALEEAQPANAPDDLIGSTLTGEAAGTSANTRNVLLIVGVVMILTAGVGLWASRRQN